MTVAIVDAFDNPTVSSDLATFCTQFGLPQMDGLGGDPTFTKATPQGLPAFNSDWAGEIALDVEWVHAAAPKANILLVETVDSSYFDGSGGGLIPGVVYAAQQPGVVVVSNSYGGGEFSGETSIDPFFVSFNAGNGKNVAYTYSTGDFGANGSYPAYSPNVVAVGGTSLYVRSALGQYGTEFGWSGSGGGISAFEPAPAFQPNGTGMRLTPDVSMVADPVTGVAVYSVSAFGGWTSIGGTSLACPLFAGVTALADQQRVASSLPTLTSAQLNTDMYFDYFGILPPSTPSWAASFHDPIIGSNGYSAGPGYDLVTGLGTPKVPSFLKVLQN
jgi:subtilase family serine protease